MGFREWFSGGDKETEKAAEWKAPQTGSEASKSKETIPKPYIQMVAKGSETYGDLARVEGVVGAFFPPSLYSRETGMVSIITTKEEAPQIGEMCSFQEPIEAENFPTPDIPPARFITAAAAEYLNSKNKAAGKIEPEISKEIINQIDEGVSEEKSKEDLVNSSVEKEEK